ncbi:acyltransferase [Methanolobus sp. WCC1]|jgi:acetyltransferase-like isoleucine patch superfamily enzyme|uniref:acyltransferase n=1 Tax=unclassified Methanolobus TaxID=2629569 RepID=UPI00258B0B43|nr:acyltransferase [Methanolobus sp.]MDK2830942.1 hypothetical protein [Methanolobus sp.]
MIVHKIIKKIAKFFASTFPSNGIRILLYRYASYNIGNDVYIGNNVLVIDRLSDLQNLFIGDRASISSGVTFVTASSPNKSRIVPYVENVYGKIVVENDAWIGTGAIILPNITIGEGAIVGAGAVVTKDVPAFTVVAGVPAKKMSEVIVDENYA